MVNGVLEIFTNSFNFLKAHVWQHGEFKKEKQPSVKQLELDNLNWRDIV